VKKGSRKERKSRGVLNTLKGGARQPDGRPPGIRRPAQERAEYLKERAACEELQGRKHGNKHNSKEKARSFVSKLMKKISSNEIKAGFEN